MYFMSTVCGRPQGGRESGPCGHMRTGGRGGQKRDFCVDVIKLHFIAVTALQANLKDCSPCLFLFKSICMPKAKIKLLKVSIL